MAFYPVPEGVAAPYAHKLGGGPIATGLVLASTAFATMIATRCSPGSSARASGWP